MGVLLRRVMARTRCKLTLVHQWLLRRGFGRRLPRARRNTGRSEAGGAALQPNAGDCHPPQATLLCAILFLQSGLFGTFTALNFFHWFIFWELSLIPAFFLVRLWGGLGRVAAANQFFLYTMAGSVAMLLAFLAIYLATGKFDFPALAELGRSGALASALSAKLGWFNLSADQLALIILGGVLLGFAVKWRSSRSTWCRRRMRSPAEYELLTRLIQWAWP